MIRSFDKKETLAFLHSTTVFLFLFKLTRLLKWVHLFCIRVFNRSDVIWEEQNKKGRWKAMKVRVSDELEAAWTKIESEKTLGATPNYIYKFDHVEVKFIVDFLFGKMLRHSSFQRMCTQTTRSKSLCAATF